MSLPYLVGIDGPCKGMRIPLRKGRQVLGRQQEAEICLAKDESVSDTHAVIGIRGQQIRIVDAGGSGIWVNEKKVEAAFLKPKDRLRVGNSIFRIEAAPKTSTAAQPLEGFHLSGRSGPYAGQTFDLSPGTSVIGRSSGCQIALERDTGVSEEHAIIEVTKGTVTIRDRGTKEGILVNGKRVSAATLAPGDAIWIGETEFVLEPTGTQARRAPSAAREKEVAQAPAGLSKVLLPVAMLLIVVCLAAGGIILYRGKLSSIERGSTSQGVPGETTSDAISPPIAKVPSVPIPPSRATVKAAAEKAAKEAKTGQELPSEVGRELEDKARQASSTTPPGPAEQEEKQPEAKLPSQAAAPGTLPKKPAVPPLRVIWEESYQGDYEMLGRAFLQDYQRHGALYVVSLYPMPFKRCGLPAQIREVQIKWAGPRSQRYCPFPLPWQATGLCQVLAKGKSWETRQFSLTADERGIAWKFSGD